MSNGNLGSCCALIAIGIAQGWQRVLSDQKSLERATLHVACTSCVCMRFFSCMAGLCVCRVIKGERWPVISPARYVTTGGQVVIMLFEICNFLLTSVTKSNQTESLASNSNIISYIEFGNTCSFGWEWLKQIWAFI